MSTQTLNHRERVLLALDHQPADRVPIAMVCSGINPPARAALAERLAERGLTVDAYLQPLLDIRGVDPRYIGPPLPPGMDIWGVRRAAVSYGAGAYDEIVRYPLAEIHDPGELDSLPWPSADWFDYASLPRQIAAINQPEPYGIMLGHGGNLFETSWYMRGLERAFMDLALRPELFAAIMERVTRFYLEYCRRALEAAPGLIDLVFTADDIGGQKGLLLSLPMWEAHIKPYHARLNATIHGLGARVIYHTDGSVMRAVPGLIDMGIDVLQALQFDAEGMDPVALKQTYGDRLSFEGGVSVQRTLPFCSPEEVRQEVLERVRVLGHRGGYILGPSHAIQAGTPPDNILALFDTAAACINRSWGGR
jgi:uroporphyrinogen decarboxylase